MRYYVIDENNVIVNSIALEDGVDPASFGAVADDRVFDIGDTWMSKEDENRENIESALQKLGELESQQTKNLSTVSQEERLSALESAMLTMMGVSTDV